jgi:hypothetical protein
MSNQKLGIAALRNKKTVSNLRSEYDAHIIMECWSILSERLSVLFPVFFSKLDDDLFRRSDKAENNAMQNLYFEVMRQMRMDKESIQKRYFANLENNYKAFWQDPIAPTLAKREPPKIANTEDDFSLIGDDTLEENLAISSMIEKGNSFFRRELYALNKRFAEIYEQDLKPENNPLSPNHLCAQFEATINEKHIHLTIKLLIYKIFDREVLSLCGPIYTEINSYLSSQGILPTVNRLSRQSTEHEKQETALTGNPLKKTYDEEMDVHEQAAYLESFRSLQSLLMAWRQHLGQPSLAANETQGEAACTTSDVLNALNLFQQTAIDNAISSLQGEMLKNHLARQLNESNPDSQHAALNRSEEDAIDMVQMIFDFILDDKNLPDAIKGIIARLQIPIIKTAIIDKTFFARRSHPARLLLNNLAQAGLALDLDTNINSNPTFIKIGNIVARIIHEFNQDIALFSELLEEFKNFMEREATRYSKTEERTRQATQSKEKLWLAKKTVAIEITVRLQGKETPTTFQSFLYNDWKDVLILSYLRQDKEPDKWEETLRLLDKLIWSVTPPRDLTERSEIIRAIPPLLKQVKGGLESISLEPHQVASLLKDLEKCHMACLRASSIASKTTGQITKNAPLENRIKIRDPQIAEAITEIREHLPDISNIDIEEVVVGDIIGIFPSRKVEQSAEIVNDEYLQKAKSLNIGEWLEFLDDNKSWRGKLSWKSPVTSLCVFVNRRGAKVAEMRTNELAIRMRQGLARVVDDSNVPLMDRALTSIIESLKAPFWKTSQPPAYSVFISNKLQE